MISSLLTIVIPTKNSLLDLKKTIENLIDKTKISGTNILIADSKSTDGTIQYAIQASSELIKKVRISPIAMKSEENLSDLIGRIKTPYVMVILPGTIMSDPDIIISSLNRFSPIEPVLLYLRKKSPLDALILPLIKRKRKVVILFSPKTILSNISINYESAEKEILFNQKDLRKKIKILGFVD